MCARIRCIEPEDPKQLQSRVRKACRDRLENYKVPMKFEISNQSLTTPRFKLRRGD